MGLLEVWTIRITFLTLAKLVFPPLRVDSSTYPKPQLILSLKDLLEFIKLFKNLVLEYISSFLQAKSNPI